MGTDKGLLSGSAAMLVLSLLEEGDKYGYQMIEELDRRSDSTFAFKAGTLYPLLHSLEQQGCVTAYDGEPEKNRPRRYYRLTPKGRKLLLEKKAQWDTFSRAVNRVIGGAFCGA